MDGGGIPGGADFPSLPLPAERPKHSQLAGGHEAPGSQPLAGESHRGHNGAGVQYCQRPGP